MENHKIKIGIDVGGTKICAGLVKDGNILTKETIPTPITENREKVIESIHSIIKKLKVRNLAGIGIGVPGLVNIKAGVVYDIQNIPALTGVSLKETIEKQWNLPVYVNNDANCFAVSEATDGAAAGAPVVFGVIIGTGTGGGICIDGRPLIGANAISGEWGHNPLPWSQEDELPGTQCYCGQRGCIETFLSGPGMSRDHLQHTATTLSAKQIIALAEQNNDAALQTLYRYEDRLARGLASIINILDPDVIVLGGGLSNIARLYENVPGLWSQYVFSDRVDTRLVPPMHGDSSGARGAAWLWPLPV